MTREQMKQCHVGARIRWPAHRSWRELNGTIVRNMKTSTSIKWDEVPGEHNISLYGSVVMDWQLVQTGLDIMLELV